jgi:hypothetical protein
LLEIITSKSGNSKIAPPCRSYSLLRNAFLGSLDVPYVCAIIPTIIPDYAKIDGIE